MSDQGPWQSQTHLASRSHTDSPYHSIDASRAAILDAIGESPDVTFVRTSGNLGDQLIWAGTRRLLGGHIYREIDFADIATARGEVAVISGGGAWSRRYCAYTPELLAIAELRFSKVIVLPSTFEVAADRVRRALDRSNAVFFAREHESFSQIRGLCDARAAHDCAMFFDYEPYRSVGAHELNAFRTDQESAGLVDLPGDNDDISETADTLDRWLTMISEHATVNTDRAHVMIAAALMGKSVRFAPSGYFKVEAIAATLPEELDVEPLTTIAAAAIEPTTVARSLGEHQTTVVVIGHDDPAGVARSLDSLRDTERRPRVEVFDGNSSALNRRQLAEVVERDESAALTAADRSVDIADVAKHTADRHAGDYVMFLKSGMRLEREALERLVAVLDADPDAVAATPACVDATGNVESCGGWLSVGVDALTLRRTGRDLDVSALREDSYVCGWVPLHGTLFRYSALHRIPIERYDDPQVQSVDWCRRATQLERDGLRACPTAHLRIEWPSEAPTERDFRARIQAVHALVAHAEYFDRHRLLLTDRLGMLVPDLRDGFGEVDETKARLLLAHVSARGPEWTLMEWMNGGLEPLLGPPDGLDLNTMREHAAATQRREHLRWLEQRNERLIGIETGRWWRLRERLQPLRRLLGRKDAGSAR